MPAISKRRVTAVFALLLLALLLIQPDWLLESLSKRVTYSVRTDEPIVALTIDDGPDASTTPAILDLLSEYGAAANADLSLEFSAPPPGGSEAAQPWCAVWGGDSQAPSRLEFYQHAPLECCDLLPRAHL